MSFGNPKRAKTYFTSQRKVLKIGQSTSKTCSLTKHTYLDFILALSEASHLEETSKFADLQEIGATLRKLEDTVRNRINMPPHLEKKIKISERP